MAKRQVRIKNQNLKENISEFSGQKIHIIKKNGSVIFIELSGVNQDSLTGKNMRLNHVNIPFEEIEEVIVDIQS